MLRSKAHGPDAVPPNQLTVIKANQENWVTEILPRIEAPQRDRIGQEPRLEGIRIDGGRELAAGRLQEYGFESREIARFFTHGWVEQVFSLLPELGVRAFLIRAATIGGDGSRSQARP